MDCKQWALVTLSILGLSNTALAVNDMQVRNIESRLQALEQKRGSGMINPPASPIVKSGVDMGVSLKVILWKPVIDGEAYAFAINQDATNNSTEENTKSNHYKWRPGFSFGLNYHLPHDGWMIFGDYTRFASTNEPIETAIGKFEPVEKFPASARPNYSQIKLEKSLDFHLGNFGFKREFFVSKQMTLSPSMGLRAIRMSRDSDVQYKYIKIKDGPLEDLTFETVEKHTLQGIGPSVGLSVQWGIASGWSLFQNQGFSFLYTEHEGSLQTSNSDKKDGYLRKNNLSDTSCMVDSSIGIRYDHLYYNEEYRLRCEFAWEGKKIMGLLDESVLNKTNLWVSGVIFKVALDF